MSRKQKLIELIVARLEQELDVARKAAQSAHEAATHEESVSEDKHDTRGVEASYLAGAQAGRATELENLISIFRLMSPREFTSADSIAPGALVELASAGRRSWYFLVSHGGGVTVQWEGRTVQVITPKAPLGDALIGQKIGDEVEVEAQSSIREYEILNLL